MIELQAQQEIGRAKNAIQDYLIRKLLLPKVYLDADWGGATVDVLAIDRGGVGDVHAVRIVFGALQPAAADILETVKALEAIPSHFRYVAAVVSDLLSRRYESIEPVLQAADRSERERRAFNWMQFREIVSQYPRLFKETTFDNLPLHIQDWFKRNQEENAQILDILRETLAKDGVGRVGLLLVDVDSAAEGPEIRILLKPERFRSSKEIVELADQYVASHTANWEVRE